MYTPISNTLDVLPFDGMPRWSQLNATQQTQTPFAQVARVRIVTVNAVGTMQTDIGSAWFCTPTTLVTAQHVVLKPFGADRYHIHVTPGGNPSATQYASRLSMHPSLDLALIHLPNPVFAANQCLTPGVSPMPPGSTIMVNGYALEWGLGMVHSPGTISASANGVLYYDVDTVQGMSGCPVMANGSNTVFGIHNSGTGFNSISRTNNRNVGLQMDSNILAWIHANA